MAVNTNTIVSNVYAQNYTPGSKEKTKVARNTETGEVKKEEKVTESKDLGKTIGDPKLSKEAQKYYEKLKKKYGNYDFILVSKDQKANAQANAAKYANKILRQSFLLMKRKLNEWLRMRVIVRNTREFSVEQQHSCNS